MLIAAVTFDGRSHYPGWEVILPVVGTALAIAGGTSVPRTGAEWLLGRLPFRWLGQRSYSLYLWHWPVLIVAGAARLSTVLHWGTWPIKIGLIAISMVLSMATYRWVENPLRHWRLPSERSVVLGVGAVIVTILVLSMVILATPVAHHRLHGT